MKVYVENLGIIKKAEFDVGDLTIICGANNTGKTYATYAFFGFLDYWNTGFIADLVNDDEIEKLLSTGSVKIDLGYIEKNVDRIISNACKEFTLHLPMVFAAHERYFANSVFKVKLSESETDFASIDSVRKPVGANRKPVYSMQKIKGDRHITVSLVTKAEDISDINLDWISHQVNRSMLDMLFSSVFYSPFIASIERTGAAMFQRELDITRNRLLEQVSNRDKEINPVELINTYFDRGYAGYALPVKEDVDFNRRLVDVVKHDSAIAKEHPDVVKFFDLILGGEYRATKEGLYYLPHKSNVKLTMGESASSVRSLLNIGIYIRHIAKPGDILMIDEPELNLHPTNQRLMAQVLAMLVNSGIKVFITTHSDYIIKEINTLIMLNNCSSHTSRIMEKYQYQDSALLNKDSVKAYVARKELISVDGKKVRQKHNTFVPAPIGVQGIEVLDFDETIDIMNEIQDELLFGGVLQ